MLSTSNALRLLAIVYVLSTIKRLVVGILMESALADVASSDVSELVQTFSNTSLVLHLVLLTATLVGLVGFASSIEKRRGASAAIVLLLTSEGSYLYGFFYPSSMESARFEWVARNAASTVAYMLPLIIAARRAPKWERAETAITGAILLIVVSVALPTYAVFGERYSAALQWGLRAMDIAYTMWFVVFGLKAARAIERSAQPTTPAVATEAGTGLDSGPLRVIGWAILARIGIGFVVNVGVSVSAMYGTSDALSGLTVGSTMIGAVTTLFLIGGIWGYAKYPAHQRNGSLYLVIGLLVIAVVIDVVSARATSGVRTVWTGRILMILGVVSVLILLDSLATTARSVGAFPLARLAGVTMALCGFGAFGATLVRTWVENTRPIDADALFLMALTLFVIAILALVNMLRVIFGVAKAIERPTLAGAEALPSASVVQR